MQGQSISSVQYGILALGQEYFGELNPVCEEECSCFLQSLPISRRPQYTSKGCLLYSMIRGNCSPPNQYSFIIFHPLTVYTYLKRLPSFMCNPHVTDTIDLLPNFIRNSRVRETYSCVSLELGRKCFNPLCFPNCVN